MRAQLTEQNKLSPESKSVLIDSEIFAGFVKYILKLQRILSELGTNIPQIFDKLQTQSLTTAYTVQGRIFDSSFGVKDKDKRTIEEITQLHELIDITAITSNPDYIEILLKEFNQNCQKNITKLQQKLLWFFSMNEYFFRDTSEFSLMFYDEDKSIKNTSIQEWITYWEEVLGDNFAEQDLYKRILYDLCLYISFSIGSLNASRIKHDLEFGFISRTVAQHHEYARNFYEKGRSAAVIREKHPDQGVTFSLCTLKKYVLKIMTDMDFTHYELTSAAEFMMFKKVQPAFILVDDTLYFQNENNQLKAIKVSVEMKHELNHIKNADLTHLSIDALKTLSLCFTNVICTSKKYALRVMNNKAFFEFERRSKIQLMTSEKLQPTLILVNENLYFQNENNEMKSILISVEMKRQIKQMQLETIDLSIHELEMLSSYFTVSLCASKKYVLKIMNDKEFLDYKQICKKQRIRLEKPQPMFILVDTNLYYQNEYHEMKSAEISVEMMRQIKQMQLEKTVLSIDELEALSPYFTVTINTSEKYVLRIMTDKEFLNYKHLCKAEFITLKKMQPTFILVDDILYFQNEHNQMKSTEISVELMRQLTIKDVKYLSIKDLKTLSPCFTDFIPEYVIEGLKPELYQSLEKIRFNECLKVTQRENTALYKILHDCILLCAPLPNISDLKKEAHSVLIWTPKRELYFYDKWKDCLKIVTMDQAQKSLFEKKIINCEGFKPHRILSEKENNDIHADVFCGALDDEFEMKVIPPKDKPKTSPVPSVLLSHRTVDMARSDSSPRKDSSILHSPKTGSKSRSKSPIRKDKLISSDTEMNTKPSRLFPPVQIHKKETDKHDGELSPKSPSPRGETKTKSSPKPSSPRKERLSSPRADSFFGKSGKRRKSSSAEDSKSVNPATKDLSLQ